MSSLLETVSGKMINVLDPQPEQIDINDIAWHLSRIPRFCGATIPYVPYSVAQHSIQVMKELNYGTPLLQMHGLLHDAAESYIGDIPSPIKHIPALTNVIKDIEYSLLTCIYRSLDISMPTVEDEELIHHADMVQRSIEAFNFMNSRGRNWGLPGVSFKKLQEFEEPMISIKAYDKFLFCFNELRGKL